MTHRPPPLHVIAHRFLSPAGNRAILLGMFNGWRAIKQWFQASEGTVRATEDTLWATENTLWATVFSVAQTVNSVAQTVCRVAAVVLSFALPMPSVCPLTVKLS